jgi:hypothetical protein
MVGAVPYGSHPGDENRHIRLFHGLVVSFMSPRIVNRLLLMNSIVM